MQENLFSHKTNITFVNKNSQASDGFMAMELILSDLNQK